MRTRLKRRDGFGRTALSLVAATVLLAGVSTSGRTAEPAPVPQLVGKDGRFALMVDGAPYLILGAQMHNSSNYPKMLPKVWSAVESIHANTLFAPVAWEQLEPTEGHFDDSWVDTLIAQARTHHVRLALVWFGTWKNTSPYYAPSWVKNDNARFPRIVDAQGETSYALSPCSPATQAADARAFVHLMAHLKAVDAARTVILVQVENEPGVYRSVRDHSPAAEALFAGAVPAALVAGLHKTPGTWQQVFGQDADEYFAAWQTAHYIGAVAAAGRAVYPLPMYVNAALREPYADQPPSTYASGGPTWNVLDIYKIAAPALQAEGPDIYNRPYEKAIGHMDRYTRSDNPLLIPEIGDDIPYARYLFAALGHRAIGYTPFGIDDSGYSNYPLGAKVLTDEVKAAFAANYALIGSMMREWAQRAYTGEVWGVAEPDDGAEQSLDLGGWKARVDYQVSAFGPVSSSADRPHLPPTGGVIIAKLGPDEFLVTGYHARVTFVANDPNRHVLIDRVEEGHYRDGRWQPERIWNGDQTDWGLNFSSGPQILHVKLSTY